MSVHECECQTPIALSPEKCWACNGAINPEKSVQSASPVPRDLDVELALLNSVLSPKTESSEGLADLFVGDRYKISRTLREMPIDEALTWCRKALKQHCADKGIDFPQGRWNWWRAKWKKYGAFGNAIDLPSELLRLAVLRVKTPDHLEGSEKQQQHKLRQVVGPLAMTKIGEYHDELGEMPEVSEVIDMIARVDPYLDPQGNTIARIEAIYEEAEKALQNFSAEKREAIRNRSYNGGKFGGKKRVLSAEEYAEWVADHPGRSKAVEARMLGVSTATIGRYRSQLAQKRSQE